MLIVVLIISFVSAMGINTYRSQRRQVQYNDAVLKVLTMIKTARDYATTSRSVYDVNCPKGGVPGQETFVPAEGYGVYIERSANVGRDRFVLFANTEADDDKGIEKYQFDEVEGAPCESDLIEEVYQLSGEAVLTDLLTNMADPVTPLSSKTKPDENRVVILFKNPGADTTIAANDRPVTADLLTLPLNLYLQFDRPTASTDAPSAYIHVNQMGGFAEILNQ